MKRRTILIVDDEELNRTILGNMLKEEYKLLYASNGKEAMDILEAQGKDISAVLLDIVMPEMGGYEVLKAMHENKALSQIPVIISSVKGDESSEVKALSLGAQDFIAKPYRVSIIRQRLANIIKFRETAALVNYARRDELTGLYSKRYFNEKVKERLSENPDTRYDLLCVDIERFKVINDSFGMAIGDRILQKVADIIKEEFMEEGVCSRFSADDFYVLLPHDMQYKEKLISDLMQKENGFPQSIKVKLKYGIYGIDDLSLPVNTMCDRAKLAIDTVRGKYDQWIAYYDDAIRERLLMEQKITNNMEKALAEKQFHVYYQPKYELNGERIAGAEALVRWIHPQKGIISPGDFIPLFEKNGFITKLDMYVWETVCRDIQEWIKEKNAPIAISVNVSRADIYNAELIDILENLVEKYKIPREYLHLEITESAYTEDSAQIIKVVDRLRSLGFLIEMDDFGSGYSSLNMLSEMPIDVLKLDTRFIQQEAKQSTGKGILSFVISLAKWLDLAVVAEGVETKEQVVALQTMDCNYVQGYYYAKPMPKDDFFNLLHETQYVQMQCKNYNMQEEDSEKYNHVKKKSNQVMLIVDDIEVNRAVLAETFAEDYVIQEVSNGKEAWDYLLENSKDVIIVMLDLLMPVMDGYQLLERMQKDSRTSSIAVIITSQGDAGSEKRALLMGADDFISKPYDPEMIKHRVNNVVDHSLYQKMMEK